MNPPKGFSLVEVLTALSLIAILSFSLLQQQSQSKQLLNQLVLRQSGSQFLDQISESLLADLPQLPSTPEPYYLSVITGDQKILLRLEWYESTQILTRLIG